MMIIKGRNLVVFLLYFVTNTYHNTSGYSREELQEIYPGFGTDYVLFPDEDGNPVTGYLKMNGSTRLFGFGESQMEQNVKLEYFSREYPNGVSITSKPDLANYVNKSKPIKFVTHGWMSGSKKSGPVDIRNGFLHRHDVNIFVMDWSEVSGNVFYPIPMRLTSEVGKQYGSYLNYLVEEIGVNPEDIHLVGHSLGAHVSGFAAREVRKGKIGRITGLDPALPGFDVGLVSSGTLNQNDANFVDVIHTCAGFLGYKTPLGHVDIYPNGGIPPQPGCSILQFIEACSHGRSWKIFASSLITDEPYVATRCSALEDVFRNNKSCSGGEIPIGDLTPSDARGIYYTEILPEHLMYKIDDKNTIL